MRKIASGVFLENKFPYLKLGVIVTEEGLMLVDSPVRVENGRTWLQELEDLGTAKYLTLLDSHPDRVLGARGLNLRLVAHDWTRQHMNNWSDSFKGGAKPIGAEADGLKRITGVRKAIPELTFSDEMNILFGGREIHFFHRPGPTPGAMWLVIPDVHVVFIGDSVTVSEPPYLGHADIEGWLESLDDLRSAHMSEYTIVASRDGVVQREHINKMARFLRKIPVRIQHLRKRVEIPEAVTRIATQLMKDYTSPASKYEQVLLRLQTGLLHLYNRSFPNET
jgi:glyoxylase-like metal-dependent hydrolase (beta-lactamase superfamily II)